MKNRRLKAKIEFLKNGYGVLPDMIEDSELELLSDIYLRCFSEKQTKGRKELGGKDDQGREALPQILNPSTIFPELRDLGVYDRCQEAAKYILDDLEVDLGGEHMILKPAKYGIATPWHQDQAYHDPTLLYRNINFWFPLDGATEEEGCLHFVEGSHLGSVVFPHSYLIDGDVQSALVANDQEYWNLNGVAAPCLKGSCTIHHSYCMHYAGPNMSQRDRKAFILSYRSKPKPKERPWVLPWTQ